MTVLATKKLTAKQELFAYEYVRLGLKQRAAINAGFSPATAHGQATHLTDPAKNPHVCAFIEKLMAEKRAQMAASAERIEEELARIAYLDPAGLFDGEGRLLPIQDMPEDVRRAIGSLKVVEKVHEGEDGTVTTTKLGDVEVASKLGALKQLQELKGLTRSGNTVNNINVANAAASVAVDWTSGKLAPPNLSQEDAVRAALEAAEAEEQELAPVPDAPAEEDSNHGTNGHVEQE